MRANEGAAEGNHGRETRLPRNALQRVIGLNQQALGGGHTDAFDECRWGFPNFMLEISEQAARRKRNPIG
jgi:hypothetical protein